MRRLAMLAALACLGITCGAASAQPVVVTPKPGAPIVKRTLPPPNFPKTRLRSAYTVEINRLGQVARIRSVTSSKDPRYDAMTYGNALQAFIRKDDGSAISGLYELGYTYDPATKKIARDVRLISAGGVDANAEGAVIVETRKANERKKRDDEKTKANLPDFNKIVTPSPAPK